MSQFIRTLSMVTLVSVLTAFDCTVPEPLGGTFVKGLLCPIMIITCPTGSMLRDASFVCQDKVFGAGYPGVPTMTQEEYLEKEIMEGKVVLDYKE